jgi:hypothetical protein
LSKLVETERERERGGREVGERCVRKGDERVRKAKQKRKTSINAQVDARVPSLLHELLGRVDADLGAKGDPGAVRQDGDLSSG